MSPKFFIQQLIAILFILGLFGVMDRILYKQE